MCAYTVGPKDDYERWAEIVGDSSFGWDNAMRIRKDKIEAFEEVAEEYLAYAAPNMDAHGKNGAVSVSIPKVWETPIILQLDAAEACGLGLNLDINSGDPLGLASAPSTAKNGLRITAAKAYLENAPSNLTTLSERTAVKIIFEGKKAMGIVTMNGEECKVSSP